MPRLTRRMSCRHLVFVGLLAITALCLKLLFHDPCSAAERELYESQKGSHLAGNVHVVNRSDTFPGIKDDVLNLVRIDWHDYRQVRDERNNDWRDEDRGVGVDDSRQSPGGVEDCQDRYGYRHCVSQSISVNRSLPDTRYHQCRKKLYLRDLPKVSIVVTCAIEHITVFHRAIYSIERRTPTSLIAEIIFLPISTPNSDYRLTDNDPKKFLEHHASLVLVGNLSYTGIASARMVGARRATGDILVFLHMPFEVNVNWLPSLIEPIVLDERVVTSPLTDTIDPETFQYRAGIPLHGSRTGFDWNFNTHYFDRLPGDDKTRPYRTPVMENRAFAIDKSRFLDLGGYDPGLRPRGAGEQYDLSFKAWLCGGEILYIPCSKVGLIHKRPGSISDELPHDDLMNYKRVARVWLSEYSEFVLVERVNVAVGDVSAQLDLLESLACKPFRWYLERVAVDLVKKFQPLKRSSVLGVIQNIRCKMCVSVMAMQKGSLVLATCNFSKNRHQTESLYFTSDGRIRVLGTSPTCLALSGRNRLSFETCSSLVSDQVWVYDSVTKTLKHKNSNRCLTSSSTAVMAYFPTCPKHLREHHMWIIAKDPSQLVNTSPLTNPVQQKPLEKRQNGQRQLKYINFNS